MTAQRSSLGPLFDWEPPGTFSADVPGRSHATVQNHGRSQVEGTSGNVGERFANCAENSPIVSEAFPRSHVPSLTGEQNPGTSRPQLLASAAGFGGPLAGRPADPFASPDRISDADRDRGPALRPYQVESISGVEAQYERGIQRTLLVLPTGTGKTVVFAELARRAVARGRRVLVLAHRGELLKQAAKKLHDVGVLAGIEKADQRAGYAPVVVASVASLQGKRLERLNPKEFDLVVDEAHHAPARSYRAIFDHFPGARILGVTATPNRADGKALGDFFETVAYRYELRQAIRDQWLVPIVARRIFVESVDLSGIKSRAGDLAQDELAEVMATDEAVLGVVIPLLEQIGARRTILFSVDVAHARALAIAICDRLPGAARVAHGELDEDQRAELLVDFAAGRFQILVNCALYTEGFDEPSIGCVAIARPTKSLVLHTQMLGRGTRLLGASWAESVRNGKTDVLVLDFVGNTGRHKLVGSLDALAAGEPVDEQVRKEADRMLLEEPRDLDSILDEAAAELERQRKEARTSANAKYFATDVDLFFGDELLDVPLGSWAQEPATPWQIATLADYGLKRGAYTQGEAARIIEAEGRRKEQGLASLKQQRILVNRVGYSREVTRAMTRKAASARMAILASCDWDVARARARLQELEATELLARGPR